MSANNFSVHCIGGYNFYSVNTNGKKYIIGGVPQELKDSYIAEASDASAIVLFTSKPEFCGGVNEVIAKNPKVEVHATAAGLRNIKEIINLDVNERLIKDMTEVDGFRFDIRPNLSWVDTVSVVFGDILFSGELFSGTPDTREDYYRNNLAVNRGFVKSAVERVKGLGVNEVFPAFGDTADVSDVIALYESLTDIEANPKPLISIIYSSAYGFTKSLAEYTARKIPDSFEVYITEADGADMAVINKSDMLIIGTNTINRNAPQSVWDVITRLDLVNKRQMPYFVFGSFGWAGDGIKLVDKTLQAMGMKQASKPVEVLFAPSDKDFMLLDKAIAKLLDNI